MCCGKRCLKYTNVAYIAFYILILSVGQILLGTYVLLTVPDVVRPETVGQLNLIFPPLMLCIAGIILIPLIILGCCGFSKEISCCVNLYSVFLILLSVAQILLGVFAIMTFTEENTELTNQIKKDITYSLTSYKDDHISIPWIQNELHCCGINSPSDWSTFKLHWSCCNLDEPECTMNSNSLHTAGCYQSALEFVINGNTVIGYASIASGILEVLVAVMGFILGCGHYRNSYKI